MLALLLAGFWPLIWWRITHDRRQAFLLLFICLAFAAVFFPFLRGDYTYTHDSISTAELAVQTHRYLQERPFWSAHEMAEAWDPFLNLGSLTIRAPNIDLFILLQLNALLPFELPPVSLANLALLNQVASFSFGLGALALALGMSSAGVLVVVAAGLGSALLPVSLYTSLAGQILYFPWALRFGVLWLKQGNSRDWLGFCGFGTFSLIAYLPTAPILSLGIFALAFALLCGPRNWLKSRLVPLLRNLPLLVLSVLLVGSILAYNLAVWDILNAQQNSSRGRSEGLSMDTTATANMIDAVRGHHAYWGDLQRFILPQTSSVPNHTIQYAGAVAAFFALWGLIEGLRQRHRTVQALAISLAATGLLALGRATFVFEALQQIPVLNLLRHYLFFLNYSFVFWALLAGFGVQFWFESKEKRAGGYWLMAVLLAATLLADAERWQAWLPLGLLALASGLRQLPMRPLVPVVLVLAGGWSETLPRSEHFGRPLPPNQAEAYPFPQERKCLVPYGHSTAWPRQQGVACVTFQKSQYTGLPPRGDHLLNQLFPGRSNTATLTRTLGTNVFQYRWKLLGNDAPIFRFVPKTRTVAPECYEDPVCLEAALLEMAKAYQKNDLALWLFDPLATPEQASGQAKPVELETFSARYNHIRIPVDSLGPGWVLRTENWDPHWRAYVDQSPREIQPGNYAFQAVWINKGDQWLDLKLETHLDEALALTEGVLLFLLVLVGTRRRTA